MKPLWHIDSPSLKDGYRDADTYHFRGWLATTRTSPVQNVRLEDAALARHFSLELVERPDVIAHFSNRFQAVGFRASCAWRHVSDSDFVRLFFDAGGKTYDVIGPVFQGESDEEEQKRRKLDRIRTLLCCPTCGCEELESREELVVCTSCSARFHRRPGYYDFLTMEARQAAGLFDTENVGANDYDAECYNFINQYHKGLILDCGAGRRGHCYENVVNFEVVPYDSTDVLGVGEFLPFKDGTFDGVFSHSVLEHVRDPFRCSREILRVLKPGGRLYCQVPFLAPFHGYPDHYYNMSHDGLVQLFTDGMEVEELEVLNFGQPIFALTWFLREYMGGLSGRTRKKFGRMRIRELLRDGDDYMGEPFVVELAPEVQKRIACVNSLIARKKRG